MRSENMGGRGAFKSWCVCVEERGGEGGTEGRGCRGEGVAEGRGAQRGGGMEGSGGCLSQLMGKYGGRPSRKGKTST